MLIKFWLAADMFYHVVLILLFAWVVILFAQLMVSVLLFSWGPAWLRTWSDLSWFINRASRFWFYFFRFRLLMPWFVLMRICGSIFDLFHIIYLSGLFFRFGSFLSILGFPFWLNYWWIAFQGSHWFNPVTLGRCLLLPLSLAVRDQSVTFIMILVSKTYNLDPIPMISLPFAPFFFKCRVTHDRSIRFCFVCLFLAPFVSILSIFF